MRTTLALFALCALSLPACSSSDETTVEPDETGGSDLDATTGAGGSAGRGGGAAGAAGRDATAGTGGAAGRDATAGAGGALQDAQPVQAWDWSGVIGNGQSLSVGVQAGNVTLKTQPFKNLKLSLGTTNFSMPSTYDANAASLATVPLVEPIRAEATTYPSAYPQNIYGETPHTAMADQISALYQRDAGGDLITVHTVVGESGMGMDVISKGATPSATLGHAYAASIFEVKALKRLATAAGKTYGVGGIILTHGEYDDVSDTYENKMYKMYTDSNADISAVTGQTQKVVLFTTQQQSCPGDNLSPVSTLSMIAQWKVGVDHAGQVVCVGPKYQYPYAGDHVHLTGVGYDQLGEKYGEVFYEKVVLGLDWQPLQPISVTRSGKVITVTFHVPVAPLVWDSAMPAPHQSAHTAWTNGKGFEVQNQSGEQTIDSVAIQGNDVVITLAADPSPTGLVVRYAVTQDGSGNQAGLATGRIGQLRDSDPLVGYATKLPQYNYAVSFELPST